MSEVTGEVTDQKELPPVESLGKLWTERTLKAVVTEINPHAELVTGAEIKSIQNSLSETVKKKLGEIENIQTRFNRADNLEAIEAERQKIVGDVLGDRAEGLNERVISWVASFLRFSRSPTKENEYWIISETESRLKAEHAPRGTTSFDVPYLSETDINEAIASLTG